MTTRRVEWSMADDGVCFEEYYDGGIGWEQRSAERLDDRTAQDCKDRAAFLHLTTSDKMEREMGRMFGRAHA
jgi:hypothetical protein